MPDLDKARVWAECTAGLAYKGKEIQAAVDVIQSLPNAWVDVEKVWELIASLNAWAEDADAERAHGRALGYRTAAENLIALLPAPSLPTLADMTQEEREACQWMQADVELLASESSVTCVIADPRMPGAKVRVWAPHGGSDDVEEGRVTPLPDLPKLEWPSSAPQKPYLFGGTSSESDLPDMSISERMERTDNSIKPEDVPAGEAALSKPEDVPANEPWLIEVDGQKAFGTRHKGNTIVPWSVAALDGSFAGDFHDNEITLIHKLVLETHALPEGMRLADHEEYGRVVVSPEDDLDGDYLAFYSDKNLEYGGSWAYPKEYELTFLDGEA